MSLGKIPSYGLIPGFAMDLRRGWGSTVETKGRAARKILDEQQPMCLIGYPPCTEFCMWQYPSDLTRPSELVEHERKAAMKHMQFACELCTA